MITDSQFDRVRRLALRLGGIELLERHRELIGRRSVRSGAPDLRRFDALLNAAEAGGHEAARQLIGLVTTKFTGFFRQPNQLEIAARHALQAARRRGAARVWSAGAATGEEPYSLAMRLLEQSKDDHPAVSILATDINEEVLMTARQGCYRESALSGIEPERRARFFVPMEANRWSVVTAVRRLVAFDALNLAHVDWSMKGSWDVILCRNVLMYLEACHRYSVLESMASLLAPDGLLILDPAEHLGRAAHLYSPGAEGLYARRGSGAPRTIHL